ncbi:hypothetical protein FKN01_03250 [Streptomyces sp. 130]|uniref:hypothetical protein n=1 Tax=Streptomyces sp. 130 TaxID=2591006 RepID=UPI00118134B2|nr:hypothetical protein [Streptomyces sp. 130]TRV81484.1 hypothetical protein FKN01_03250 [Streptomyces sp. 130]
MRVGVVAFGWLLVACAGPAQYYGGTGVHDVTATEVTGGWVNAEGARVELREDGTAAVRKLDGQDFAYDEGWRLSGTGAWRLADSEGGQVVRLALKAPARVDRRAPGTAEDTQPPSSYNWYLYVDRSQREKEVKLFSFYGDPDVGHTYVLTRTGSK